jgi:hypothetical protein
MTAERNPRKFAGATRERVSARSENAPVTKTEGVPRGYPAREGEGSR